MNFTWIGEKKPLRTLFYLLHVLADTRTHGSIQVVTFIKKELVWHTSVFEADAVTTRLVKQVKTKGGLGVRGEINWVC